METVYVGFSIRIWIYAGDPDNDVHTAGGSYADIGEVFENTNNGKLFICTTSAGVATQTWIPYLGGLLQADWSQASSIAQDYIKNKPSLATVATSGSYNDLSNKPTIPSAQIQSDWTQANTSSLDYIKNKPVSSPSRSQSSATRSLNTSFQVSSTRWSTVRYSVDISTTVSLSGSQVGTVVLETASNSAFTTGVQTLQQFSNGNTGTLVIGLVLTQLNTACVSGDVPPGNYVRIRTVNLTGTPTFTYQVGQEVLV